MIDDEVTGYCEERSELGIALLELPGPHRAVADAGAIRSRNPDVARAAMESHIVGTVAAFSATRVPEQEAG